MTSKTKINRRQLLTAMSVSSLASIAPLEALGSHSANQYQCPEIGLSFSFPEKWSLTMPNHYVDIVRVLHGIVITPDMAAPLIQASKIPEPTFEQNPTFSVCLFENEVDESSLEEFLADSSIYTADGRTLIDSSHIATRICGQKAIQIIFEETEEVRVGGTNHWLSNTYVTTIKGRLVTFSFDASKEDHVLNKDEFSLIKNSLRIA